MGQVEIILSRGGRSHGYQGIWIERIAVAHPIDPDAYPPGRMGFTVTVTEVPR